MSMTRIGHSLMTLGIVALVACGGGTQPPVTEPPPPPVEPEPPVVTTTAEPPEQPPEQPPAQPAEPVRLTLATWSITGLGARDGQGEVPRAAEDYERLRQYADRLAVDVIALQEIDGVEAARRIFPPDTYNVACSASGGTMRVCFAYKKALTATTEEVPSIAGGDGGRPGFVLNLQVAGRTLRILDVHLATGCAAGNWSRNQDPCNSLRAQVSALEEWIDARASAGEAFIVAGDFSRRLDAQDALWRAIDDGDPEGADLTRVNEGLQSQCWRGRRPTFTSAVVLGADAAPWMVADTFEEMDFDRQDARVEAALSDQCPQVVDILVPAPE